VCCIGFSAFLPSCLLQLSVHFDPEAPAAAAAAAAVAGDAVSRAQHAPDATEQQSMPELTISSSSSKLEDIKAFFR
jgi:hypothetical protein